MSRYMVNKVMWAVDRSADALSAFTADPAAYLDVWEALAAEPASPYPEGGSLTTGERQALESRDFGALYAMGVNPFLLWQFARSVSVPGEMSIEGLITSFREAVEPHGYPDFST
jgi:hypothetical protein